MKHRVDHFEGLVDLLTHFRAGKDDLAADEDQEHNLGLDHAVDETREQLGLVRAEVVMLGSKTLETDGELDVARTDNVLNLEVRELGVETELLDDTSVLARRKLRVIFGLGTGDNHLAAGEDQGSGLGLTNTHDNRSKTLGVILFAAVRQPWPRQTSSRDPAIQPVTYLGVSRVQGNRLQIKTTIEVDRRDDVPVWVSPQPLEGKRKAKVFLL